MRRRGTPVSREALYEEVWTDAVTVVAPRYGLSDVGLVKICKKLGIPVPPRGYWAKVKAGRLARKVPLPALPAGARDDKGILRGVGTTAETTCFSFYANKTITTGEGGMLVTTDERIADRARRMSLHGLSRDAWKRYAGGSWYYEILDAGYKYNLTDLAAALGRVQLSRARNLRDQRARIAGRYDDLLRDIEEIELPREQIDRLHSWHLYPLRLMLDRLSIDRDTFIEELGRAGVGASVHWMPLHLHPFYRDRFGYRPEHLPVATAEWRRLVSLPIFPGMREVHIERVLGSSELLDRGATED